MPFTAIGVPICAIATLFVLLRVFARGKITKTLGSDDCKSNRSPLMSFNWRSGPGLVVVAMVIPSYVLSRPSLTFDYKLFSWAFCALNIFSMLSLLFKRHIQKYVADSKSRHCQWSWSRSDCPPTSRGRYVPEGKCPTFHFPIVYYGVWPIKCRQCSETNISICWLSEELTFCFGIWMSKFANLHI
jgi:hypothetical protein